RVRPSPAEAHAEGDVEERRRVEISLLQAEGALAAVLQRPVRHVAGRAQHRAGAGEARLEEEPLAERDGLLARVPPGRRPRAMAQDRSPFRGGEFRGPYNRGDEEQQDL